MLTGAPKLTYAVPEPLPVPVAVNANPTVLLAAPIVVQSVVPMDPITYAVPLFVAFAFTTLSIAMGSVSFTA